MRRAKVAAAGADGAEAAGSLSPEAEANLLVQAVRSSKLPSLTAEDARLFADLVGDVWPGVGSCDVEYGELQTALRSAAAAESLNEEPDQVRHQQAVRSACCDSSLGFDSVALICAS